MKIEREYYLEKIKQGFKNNPIVVLTGARQVGKTSLMQLFLSGRDHLWLDGENPETAQVFQNFSDLETFLRININREISGVMVIDEFQYIENISLMMKLLVDKYSQLKILCSGSSSLDIIQKVNESLAGRIRIISVYSLSFEEYILFNDKTLYDKFIQLELKDNISILLPEVNLLLKEYILYGGLPKVALEKKTHEKEALLNDIYQTYLLRDVRFFIKNKDFVGFNKMLKILSSQIGNLLNINELANTLQLSYKACEEYIDLLEQMYIIILLPPYTTNKRSELSKMKKIYFTDLGLRNVIYNSFNEIDIRTDKGGLFENYVFLELKRSTFAKNLYYYRTKDKTEIDFIVVDSKGRIIPVEVKYKSFKKSVRVRAITEFAKRNNIEKAFVVNTGLNENIGIQRYVLPYLLKELM